MSTPFIHFALRIRESAGLEEMRDRVARALGCTFTQCASRKFTEPAWDTEILGLWITLSYWPATPEGELRTYHLQGTPVDEIPFAEKPPDMNVTGHVQALLKLHGSDWYVPTLEELLAETKVGSYGSQVE